MFILEVANRPKRGPDYFPTPRLEVQIGVQVGLRNMNVI
jgi:hypothetical protein